MDPFLLFTVISIVYIMLQPTATHTREIEKEKTYCTRQTIPIQGHYIYQLKRLFFTF